MVNEVQIASSLDRESLERLASYLTLHGLKCEVKADASGGSLHALWVREEFLAEAQKVLDDLVSNGEGDGDDIEIDLVDDERTVVAAWLQSLLDEHDRDGSPIYFYHGRYSEALDQLRDGGRLILSVQLMRGLKPFLPTEEKRLTMGRPLQDFFQIVDAVCAAGDD